MYLVSRGRARLLKPMSRKGRIPKVVGMLAIACSPLLLAACSSAAGSPSGSGSGSGLISTIESSHVMTFGAASYEPDNYQLPNGQWTGTVIAMANLLAKSFGAKAQFVNTSWANMVAGLQAGKYEFAIDLTETPAREQAIDFTVPVYTDLDALMVDPARTGIRSWAEATGKGKTICVDQGASPALTITKLHLAATITPLSSEDDCTLALIAGRTDSHDSGVYANAGFAEAHPGYKLIFPPSPIDTGPVAYGLPKDTPKSALQTINSHLQKLINEGEWVSISKRYKVVVPTSVAIQPVPEYVYKAENYGKK